MISLIVAVADNWAIGKNNALLWHLSEDLKYFRRTTLDHTVIMGYNTFLSVGAKPFARRRNIIVDNTRPSAKCDGYETYSSLQEALAAVSSDEEAFVIGGGMLYRTSLPYCDKLYITHVHRTVEDADVFFPALSPDEWTQNWTGGLQHDDQENVNYEFTTYIRK